jgi:hypothetical protein
MVCGIGNPRATCSFECGKIVEDYLAHLRDASVAVKRTRRCVCLLIVDLWWNDKTFVGDDS